MQRRSSTKLYSSSARSLQPLAFLFLFCLTFWAIPLVSASDVAHCETMTLDVGCSQFGLSVGSIVFVPPNSTLDFQQSTVLAYIGGINFITIEEPCKSLLIRMVCVTYLRPCANATDGTVASLPIQTCREQCLWYAAECANTYVQFGQPLGSGLYLPPNASYPLTCYEKDFYSQNVDYFPPFSVNYTLYNNVSNTYTLLNVPCNNFTNTSSSVAPTCTEELSYDPDIGGCAFTCPVPALSDGQYYDAKVMQGVIGWFSWAGTGILMLCYAVNPNLRKFPKNMVFMSALAANIAAGAIILPTYGGYDNIWCGGETQYVRPRYYFPTDNTGNGTTKTNDYVVAFEFEDLLFSSSACTFQGAMLQFGYLAATFWWGLIALNIFLEVYFNSWLKLDGTWQKWGRIIFYQMVGWGVPFLFMVIPAAAGRIALAPGGTYCFVTNEDDQAYQLTFWFLPVGITLLLGFIFFLLSLGKILVVMISLRKIKSLLSYSRLLIFIFLYLFLFCFIFSYNIQIEVNKDTITDGYSVYFQCLTRIKNDCHLSDDVSNYNLIMLKGFAISVLGFLLFLVFMSWEILKFWYLVGKSLVLLAVRRNKAQSVVLYNLFTNSRAQTTTLEGTDTSLHTKTDTTIDEHEEEDEEDEDQEEESSETSSSEGGGSSDGEGGMEMK